MVQARPYRIPVIASFAAVLAVCACQRVNPEATSLEYPFAERSSHTDVYFGETVADPYRWMEDLESDEVASWVEAENEIAAPYLADIESHDQFQMRLTELWDYERFSAPIEKGGRYFYSRNDGLQDQSVVYVAESLDDEPRVLIDPNGFSDDGTIALAGMAVGPKGNLVAYAVSDGGSDWRTWRVRDVASGQDSEDFIDYTKFTSVSWHPDESGFYYSQYPVGPDGSGDGQAQVSIYYHVLGTSQSDDTEVYAVTDHDRRNPYGRITDDGRYLIVDVNDGFAENAIYYADLEQGSGIVPLFDEWDALYSFIGNEGSTFYVWTNKDAPRWRVVAVDVERPDQIRDVIPEADQALGAVSFVGGKFIASYLADARSDVRVFETDGSVGHSVNLPGIGTASGFGGDAGSRETFYSFTSFTTPPEVYRHDLVTGESTLWRRPTVGFDPAEYETRQVFYASADGTRVPMFISHRVGVDLDQTNPTLLYGYGGFNISLTPSFSVGQLVWMDAGGILAIPNLRGGGEYGEEWHEAGTLLEKQNVFDDFIAGAEWLIENNYTSSEHLGIQGGSNGGLLVGAVMLQRPELFGAALPAVGVLDMLRYHTPSLNARAWASDYGLSEDEAEYHAQRAYSPVHNVRDGACYPPTLVTTADRDDRVVPWHSFKFGAELQNAQGCDNPILVRVETRAGHGAGKPTWMQIEETADWLAFLARHLEME